MPAWLGAIGQQVAGQAAQGAVALGLQRMGAKYDRKQQLKTQEGLNELQVRSQMGIIDYQKQKDLEMWHDTNYAAQMEELRKAGLNPGLLYGMSGGGATTTGNAGGSVSAPNAGYVDTMSGAVNAMGIDVAETKLKLAQARLAETQADKLGGVDTENVKADTAKKNQEIQNLITEVGTEKGKQALMKIETSIKEWERNFLEQTFDDRKNTIHAGVNKALGEAKEAEAKGEISYGTMEEAKNIIRGEAAASLVKSALIESQTGNQKAQAAKAFSDINVNNEQINKMAAEVAQGWVKLSQSQKIMKVEALVKEYELLYKGAIGNWRLANPEITTKQIDEIMELQPKKK